MNVWIKTMFGTNVNSLFSYKYYDIHEEKGRIYVQACEQNKTKIAQWLYNIAPEKYHLEIINNHVTKYHVKYNYLTQLIRQSTYKPVQCSICYERNCNIQSKCGHMFYSECPYCRNQNITYYEIECK